MPAGGYHPKKIRGKAIATVDDFDLQRLAEADSRVLPPPLRAFGRWLSEKRHPIEDQLAKIFELTGETWTYPKLLELRQYGAFKEYVDIMRERGLRAARERLIEIGYTAVENLDWAMAECKSAGDYSTMPKITGQITERIIPRRDDLAIQNTQINVSFSLKQLAIEESESPEVVVEPIAPDKS